MAKKFNHMAAVVACAALFVTGASAAAEVDLTALFRGIDGVVTIDESGHYNQNKNDDEHVSMAFDGKIANGSSYRGISGVTNYLYYSISGDWNLGVDVIITKYTVYGHVYEVYYPTNWTFRGQAANGEWEIISEKIIPGDVNRKVEELCTIASPKAYRNYSFAINGYRSRPVVNELIFTGFLGNSVTVSGTPANVGTPSPAYGISAFIQGENSFSAGTMPAVVSAGVRANATGADVTIDNYLGGETRTETKDGASFTLTGIEGDIVSVKWNFDYEYQVSATSADATLGSVAITTNNESFTSGGWSADGATFTVTATPEDDAVFMGWEVQEGYSLPASFDIYADTQTFRLDGKPVNLTAHFRSDAISLNTVYVDSITGDDFNIGDNPKQAKQTLAAAFEAVEAPGTIILSAGTYDNIGGFTLDKAVTIRGADGVSRDDIIIAGYDSNTAPAGAVRARNFYISNKDASVSGVTITGGSIASPDTKGGSIYIEAGMVSNCVVRGGSCYVGNSLGNCLYLGGDNALLADSLICDGRQTSGSYGQGGGAYLEKGRITRCIFRNNSAAGYRTYGNALKITGGICDNSLFVGNFDTGSDLGDFFYGTVNLSGGVLANSTIVANESFRSSGVTCESDKARVVNCIIAGNTVAVGADYNKVWFSRSPKYASCYSNCISDVAIDGGIDCRTYSLSEIGFVDFEGGDYRLLAGSPAVNTGADYEYAGVKALDGAPRQGAVDVGCYEYHSANEPTVAVLADKSGHAVPATVTYTANTDAFESDALSYEWTITNTDSDETVGNLPNSRSISVPFDEVGRYSVKVSVNSGAAEYTMPSLTKIVPNEIYLVPNTAAYSNVTPAYPYNGWDKAFKSIHEAINFAEDGCVIVATNSTDNYSAAGQAIVLDKAITVKSLTGKPEDVRFIQTTSKTRLFSIVNRKARLEGITAAEGRGVPGACITMPGGGTADNCIVEDNTGLTSYSDGQLVYTLSPYAVVTNCVLRNATSKGNNTGIAVRMNAGLMTHCVISNNVANGEDKGIAVYLAGGRIENSLIAGNSNNGSTAYGTIYIDNKSAEVVNCTIVDNKADYASGVYFHTSGGTVANSAIVNNSSSTPKSGYDHFYWCHDNNNGKKYGTLLYSAGDYSDEDSSNWTGENNISGTLEDFDFVDPENDIWRPGKNSILFDKGSLEWNRASLDLDGNARILHKNRIDIGCYEHQYISPATIMMLK